MNSSTLESSVAPIPPGKWAVAVSGGADSVALLHLLQSNESLRLHVVHLDHELRGAESAGDAEFVRGLAQSLNIPVTIARRSEIEPGARGLPVNPSARYRALRYLLFKRVVQEYQLDGVILAHHADDQAETVLQRLLRGSGIMGIAGMSERTRIFGVEVLRPLLGVRRAQLREYLAHRGLPWREDASNISPKYLRNRLRPVLAESPQLHEHLVQLSDAARECKHWIEQKSPVLPAKFRVHELADLPEIIARHAAARWLRARGAPVAKLSPATLDRLIEMASDAASPSHQNFPGNVVVRRTRGMIGIAKS